MAQSMAQENNPPLITIVTVTYNAAEVLEPTMKSVREQTATDFEHLIIDGASTDNTLEVARKYASPNLRIVSEPDKGLYDAMNKGLNLAKGNYVIFLNAGDSFHTPDTLQKYYEVALKGADIIYGDTVIVDKERKVIGPRHLSAPEELTHASFADGMLVCHQAMMVSREIWVPYNLKYRFSADYNWACDCLFNSVTENFVNLHCVTIDYLADGLTDKNKWKSLRERFDIMCDNYGLLPTIGKHFYFVFRALKRKFR